MDKKFKLIPLVLAMVSITGCSLTAGGLEATSDAVDEVRQAAGMTGETGMTEGGGLSAVVVSQDAVLDLRPIKSSDAFPEKVKVTNFSANNATLEQMLMLAFADSGISYKLDYEGSPTQSMVTSVNGFTGTLNQLMDVLSDGLGFYYTYDARNNLVTVSPMQTFAVSLPPVPEAHESVLKIVQKLGATTPILDESSSQLIFTANKSALKRIDAYLDMLRENLSLIHYEVYIMQVALERGGELGVRWNDFATSNGRLTGLTGGATASANAFTTTLTYANQNFSMNALMNFLSTQGETQTLSQPRIDAVSGFPAKLEVINEDRYVSKIGVAPSVAGSAPVKTVETEDLKTGLVMSVLGNYRDETVFTQLDLTFSTGNVGQLIDLGDGKVNLPRKQGRNLKTKVRAKPGEVVVLSGLIQDDSLRNDVGVPFFGSSIPVGRADSFIRKELVVVLKPSVTLYKKQTQ